MREGRDFATTRRAQLLHRDKSQIRWRQRFGHHDDRLLPLLMIGQRNYKKKLRTCFIQRLKLNLPRNEYFANRIEKQFMEQIRKISKEQIVMAFVATCIETTARLLNTNYYEIYQRMERVGMIDNYIVPNYEPLHSESREVLAERMIECLKNWEEKL